MQLAPPPPGSRIQEVGDRLIVHFRPRRRGIVFLLVWLTLWTGVGEFVLGEVRDGSEGWFMLVWLCGWVFGECAVLVVIAWLLWGRTFLIATTELVEVRRQLGRFARSKSYAVELVRDVRAGRVPHDEDERPRDDYGLEIVCRDRTIHVGEGMDEREAEEVAAATRAWIRARTPWGDFERDDPYRARERSDGAPTAGATQRLVGFALKSLLFPAIVVAILAYVTLLADRPTPEGSPSMPTGVPAAAAPGPVPARPSPDAFASAREFAAAMTLHTLAAARTRPHGPPSCSAESPTRWSCGLRASATAGPYAGHELTYHCSQSRPHAVHCEPLDPPVS